MRDPFFPPPVAIVRATQPLANSLALRTLPLHVHEILPAFSFYQFIETIAAPRVSSALFPKQYDALPERTKRSWNVHVVSLVQSCLINGLALWVIYQDTERGTWGWERRVWGYSGATGMVQGFSAGYFLWDIFVSARDVDGMGWGGLMHATSALVVSLLGFRPFVNYYGLNLVLYELSTPFLNIHWFLDKLGKTGSWAQLINGIVLIATFGASRLVWGTYQTYWMYQDILMAMKIPGELPVPPWLAVAYLASNTVLGALNVYWFGKMIQTVSARFQKKPSKSGEKGE